MMTLRISLPDGRGSASGFLALLACVISHAATRQECEIFRHHGQLSEASACYQKLANEASPAIRAEGFWGLHDLQTANAEFRKAVGARPKDAMLRVRWGRLMMEGNNREEAAKLFGEAIEIEEDFPPALLGLAIVANRNI